MRISVALGAIALTVIFLTGPALAGCAIELDEVTGIENLVCGSAGGETAWAGLVWET